MNNFARLRYLFGLASITMWVSSSFMLYYYSDWYSFFILAILAVLFMAVSVNAAFKDGEASVAK